LNEVEHDQIGEKSQGFSTALLDVSRWSLDRFLPQWEPMVVPLTLVVIVSIFSLVNVHFLSPTNILNILNQVSIMMVVTAAASLVIFVGGFDLSARSTVALSGVAAALVTPI
jgi:ribose transport system permease protein